MSTRKESFTATDAEKHDSNLLDAGDVALGVFEDICEGEDAVDDRKLLWKIDMRLMRLL